jgi:hypothetical protein
VLELGEYEGCAGEADDSQRAGFPVPQDLPTAHEQGESAFSEAA